MSSIDEDDRVPAPAWSGQEKALLVGSVVLITLSAFEALATATIMPNVMADLRSDQWFSVASGAALAATMLTTVIAGALSDSRGPRQVLIGGVVLFGLGLVLCAVAPHVAVFVCGRVIQGLGAGLVIVPLYVLVGAVATDRHRPTFFAAFSLAWVLPSLIGPAIAGFVAVNFGWRIVFGAVPAISALAVLLLIPALGKLETGPTKPSVGLGRLGTLALICGLGVMGLQLAGAIGGPAAVVVGVAGFIATVATLPRLLPKGLFTFKPGLPSYVGVRLFAMGAVTASNTFLPLMLQRTHGWHADAAGLAVSVGSIAWAGGSTFQARVKDLDHRRRLPLLGTISLVLGIVLIATLAFPGAPEWIGITGGLFAGFGVGTLHSTISDLTLGMTEQSRHGMVSSWLQVADNGGTALELAIVSVALAAWSQLGTTVPYLPAVVIALLVGGFAVASAARAVR